VEYEEIDVFCKIYKVWDVGAKTIIFMIDAEDDKHKNRILKDLRRLGCKISNKEATNLKIKATLSRFQK